MNRKLAAQCLSELGNLTRLDIYRLLVRAGLDGMKIGDIQTRRLGVPWPFISADWSGPVWSRRRRSAARSSAAPGTGSSPP